MSPALILALVQLGIQFTPVVVKDVANLIHGNPKTAAETDAEYVARIGGQIDQDAANIAAQDKAIQGE